MDLQFAGGLSAPHALRIIEERETEYPQFRMFGPLPAYGFFCRHVRGLHLENIRFATVAPDGRPAVVAEDVEGFTLRTLDAPGRPGQHAFVWLRDVRGAMLSKLHAEPESPVLVRVDGAANTATR